jgi:hypothetical protein
VSLLAVAVYFGQYLTTPPNSSEGAVMMDYVQRFSDGQRLHFDVFDYYGPFAWLPFRVAYSLAGQQLIGVRVCLLALKLACVLLTYVLIRGLGSSFHAVLGSLVIALLLGQPWPFFQIPYAPHVALPTSLLVLCLLMHGGSARVCVAAILTAVLFWTKVNAGAFVFAGSLILVAYFPPPDPAFSRRRLRASPFAVGFLALLLPLVVALFLIFSREHVWTYFAYLSGPLLLGLAWAALWLARDVRDDRDIAGRIRVAAMYSAVTGCTWLVVLMATFGIRESGPYLREQIAVLTRLQLDVPMPGFGASGQYSSFNAHFWPELLCAPTVIALSWLGCRALSGRRTRGQEASATESRLAGLFAIGTFHNFVIYPRSDEAHLVQAVSFAVVIGFAMLAVIDTSAVTTRRPRSALRVAAALAGCLATASLLSLPAVGDFRASRDWHNPRLSRLRFHNARDVRANEVDLGVDYAQWDAWLDQVAQKVEALTEPGEEVMVLSGAQLINYASNTRPAGGRYSHFFYMIQMGLLDRKGFLELVPAPNFHALLSDPPRVVVLHDGDERIVNTLPELLHAIRGNPYVRVGVWGCFAVYQRRDRRVAQRPTG